MNPYEPQKLPVSELDYRNLITYVGTANAALARYDGLLHGIVNPSIMLSPLTTEEAVLSSRLEGTQATVDDIFEHDAGILKEDDKNNDIQEVLNYRKALCLAQETLQNSPISLHLVRAIHKELLDSVRGHNKSPGVFREDQNWIGAFGCTLDEAVYVPPSPLRLLDHLEDWIHYVNSKDIDILIQSAIMHAQFEIIHPFKDGNGRIGRLLIPLFLYQKKLLSQPMFYLSAYLEQHREEYYHTLKLISLNNDWNSWIVFFLRAVVEQSNTNTEKVKQILDLYNNMKNDIQRITHSQHTIQILDYIFRRPIFKSTDFINEERIVRATGMALLSQLKSHNILTDIVPGKGRRPTVFAFPALLSIVEGRRVI